jgi:ferric-dicitrate binding protein FerR (iron transport regulator)
MEKDYYNKLFVRFINGELEGEELEEFKKSPKFELYNKIAIKSGELETIGFDKDLVLSRIKKNAKPKSSKPRIKRLVKYTTLSAAASILLLVGVFTFMNRTTKFQTAVGEQLAIHLPDHSKVILNERSTLTYKKRNWDDNRSLKLDGEAYFRVEKGSKFVVKTNLGTVSVLGTQFSVKTHKSVFEAVCFEGSVHVKTKEVDHILTRGELFIGEKNKTAQYSTTSLEKPKWVKEETNFDNFPLRKVIILLEQQYNIKINASNIDVRQSITGSFIHNNLEVALQTVFVPLNIGVEFQNKDTVYLIKK